MLAAPNLFYSRVESHNDAVKAIETSGSTPEREAEAAQWPSWLPSDLVNLGLDLRGGAHLLAEVRVADVYAARMESLWPDVRDVLRDARDEVGTIRLQDRHRARQTCRCQDQYLRSCSASRGLAPQGFFRTVLLGECGIGLQERKK